MKMNKPVFTTLLIGVVLLMLISCAPAEVPASTPIEDDLRGTLRFAHRLGWGGEESVDPSSGTSLTEVALLVYNRLVRLDAEHSIVAELAQSWEANEDATEWTFVLHNNVLFHNGDTLTAADVKFSFERIINPDSGSPLSPVLNMLESVEVIDDQTVLFHLYDTSVDFPLLLTDHRMRILAEGAEVGIGTGPFQVSLFEPRNITVLTAFDPYWEGKPQLRAVEIIAMPETSSQLDALRAGQLHLVDQVSSADSLDFAGLDDFSVQSIPTGDWPGIVFRTDLPPFDDVRVRRAVRLVVDRQEMIDLVTNGAQGAVLSCDSPVWSGDKYYDPIDCAPDLDEARRLLKAAGYEDSLRFTITTSDLNPNWRPMVEVYQFQAAKAGIIVDVVEAPSDGYWTDVWKVEPVVTTSWLERTGPQVLSEAFRTDAVFNETYWSNQEFESLLDEAAGTQDNEKRAEIYSEVQQLLRQESGVLIPFHLNQGRVVAKTLSGVEPVNLFSVQWHKVEVKDQD